MFRTSEPPANNMAASVNGLGMFQLVARRVAFSGLGIRPLPAVQRLAARGLSTAAQPEKQEDSDGDVQVQEERGPETLEDVQSFLLRLFSDKDLIPLPAQSFLAPRIAKRRTPKIQE
ncbi:hypothetical protein Bbelb_216200, partial [Branchiostoma belcheri]